MRWRPLALGLVGFVCFLGSVSRTARAGNFDPQGNFSFDATALVSINFEKNETRQAVTWVPNAPDALEGASFIRVDTSAGDGFDPVAFPLALTPANHAYRARMFVRTNRVVGDIMVDYPDNNEGAGQGQGAGQASPDFTARFFPTGRVTSDGWYEVSTARFSIEGVRNPVVTLSLIASNADIDAFEIVADGEFRKANACSEIVDSACGAGEFCAAGWCRNGDVNVPALPDEATRASVANYLSARVRNLFGGRFTRESQMPTALRTFDKIAPSTDGWTFWNGVATALHQLHDWHTTTSAPVVVDGRGAFPVCVVEGDADLSKSIAPSDPAYPDVIVSHVGPTKNSNLKPGDRIVAVDGMHPLAFVESLESIDWGYWRADDTRVHAEAAERLRFAIRRWGKTITIIRCDATSKTCSAPETIDLATLPPESEDTVYPQCDHRPAYHLKTGNPDATTHNSFGVSQGLLADSTDGENLYGMIWNDVNMQPNGRNRYKTAIDNFRANARGVVMDHRTGNGGTEYAAEYLTSLFRLPAKLGVATGFNGTLGFFDAPFDTNDALGIFDMRKNTSDAYDVGATDARSDLPVALMLARDGSASDWFPLGMKGVPNVRLFGRRTAGAFSSFVQFDYYGQVSWQFASGDLVLADGSTRIGHGVEPDEEILPKQSDLLVGTDTVYERALAWVRSCLTSGACK